MKPTINSYCPKCELPSYRCKCPEKAHKAVRQDDSAIDYGGPGFTWCDHCKALFGTPEWEAGCNG